LILLKNLKWSKMNNRKHHQNTPVAPNKSLTEQFKRKVFSSFFAPFNESQKNRGFFSRISIIVLAGRKRSATSLTQIKKRCRPIFSKSFWLAAFESASPVDSNLRFRSSIRWPRGTGPLCEAASKFLNQTLAPIRASINLLSVIQNRAA
jgi:hypothetical protein